MLSLIKKKLPDIILDIVRYFVIAVIVVLCIYPFYYVVICSVSGSSAAKNVVALIPQDIDFTSYSELFKRNDILMSFLISVSRTIVGTIITVCCTSMLAFLLTRKEMIGRKFVYRFVIITMYIGAGLIPWYLVMKAYHLQNSFLLYVIPSAINAYYMILIKTFMEQLPESMEEAAIVEGAGFFDLFLRIIIPLSKPIIATICVYCAVGQWNSWQDNMFLVSDKNLQTMQYILYKYLNEAEAIANAMKNNMTVVLEDNRSSDNITPLNIRLTCVVITTTPIMLVYPFAQKYFTKGIMLGAVKG